VSNEKQTKQPKRRLISNAPPPPAKIKGGTGDPGLRPKRPDWDYWNKMPVLSIKECVMLLINVEPNSYLSIRYKEKLDHVRRLVQSYQAIGELPADDDDFEPSRFVEWAESVGMVARNYWKPMGKKHTAQDQFQSVRVAAGKIHVDRFNEAVNAAIAMLKDGKRPQLISNIVRFMYVHPERFPACCGRKISDDSLLSSIRKGGRASLGISSPLESPKYGQALESLGA